VDGDRPNGEVFASALKAPADDAGQSLGRTYFFCRIYTVSSRTDCSTLGSWRTN
jgi:hypothetical protein